MVRCFLNDGNQTAVGVADENAGRFGSIALFAAGDVQFKDVAYKDLSARVVPAETISPRFRMQRVSDMFYSWGAAAADFNKDGAMDIVAGPYIYFWAGVHELSAKFFQPFPSTPPSDFAEINCEYAFDFTGDGWPDVLTGPGRTPRSLRESQRRIATVG